MEEKKKRAGIKYWETVEGAEKTGAGDTHEMSDNNKEAASRIMGSWVRAKDWIEQWSILYVLLLECDLFFTSFWQPTPKELINMTKKTHHILAVRHWACVCVCVCFCECVLEGMNVGVFVGW